MEHINCIVCGSNNYTTYTTNLLDGLEKINTPDVKGMTIVKCNVCGLFYFNPIDSDEVMNQYYNVDYFVPEDKNFATGYECYIDEDHIRAKISWGVDPIMRWFNEEHQNNDEKIILDVGCAVGALLIPMKEKKWICTGVDVSSWAVNYGKLYYDLDLLCGHVYNIDYCNRDKFNCILLWDSFEHEKKPYKMLETLYQISTEDVVGIIQTPDSFYAEEDWYYWSPHQHVAVYNIENLTTVLEKTGFVIVEEKVSPEPDELVVVFRKKKYIGG